ncbi:uncharacterized protein [Nicotiana sylvestris]|uniref:uncharacterized protein n=1 Tax=Nicotiana sylvestris TaxID=4096 RepID=UPI00388C7B2E
MAPYEALYGRRYRSPIRWFEPGEAKLYGTDLVQDALDKVKLIQERLRTAQYRQKSYTDLKARDVSFMVGEKVLLKVSPMKGVMRFGKKDFSTIQLDESLGYEEEPVAIIDRQDHQLRSRRISVVRVQWRGQPVKEANRESEEDMRNSYPHLFSKSGSKAGVSGYQSGAHP